METVFSIQFTAKPEVLCGECGHIKHPEGTEGTMPCPRLRANGEPCVGYIDQHEKGASDG